MKSIEAESTLGSDGGAGAGHPIMFGNPKIGEGFGRFPNGGGYPRRFLDFALDKLGCTDTSRVLHLCSGSVDFGVRVDIRPEVQPDIVADCRDTGLPDESFDWILADPPYSQEYAANLYGTGDHYPKPGQIMREASRLLRPGGRVGLLHFQVPMFRRPLRLLGVYGVTQGVGYNIRAWSLLEKGGEA